MATYKGSRAFSTQANNKSYSFGVSRQNMKKMHIDVIQDPSVSKTINIVGPGQHEMEFGWSLPKDSLRNKTGP